MSDPVLMDNGMYKIDFTRGEGESLYQDALYIPKEVYESMTPQDVQALEDQRYSDWQAFVASMSSDSGASS